MSKQKIKENVRGNNIPLTNSDNEYWLKLDNAALIYPASGNDSWNSVFRVSVNLKEKVEPDILQQALNEIIGRFPSINVQIKKGLFWYYFSSLNKIPKVEEEKYYPCKTIPLRSGNHLFRIMYYKEKIIFETFHSLTDGYGASVFLTTLISKYLILKGYNININQNIVSFLDRPMQEEYEDSFSRYANLKDIKSKKEKKAYQIHGTREEKGKLNVITLRCSASELKKISSEYSATITKYLLAVYFKALLSYQKDRLIQTKPVKISVPINLRNYLPSQTLRNFSSYINLSVEDLDKDYSIDDLVKIIEEQMSVINKDYLISDINFNVKPQRNFFVKIVPLILKTPIMKIANSMYGEKLFTTSFSNLGNIRIPEEFNEHITGIDFVLGTSKINTVNIGVATMGDNLSISFASTIKETKVERLFARELSSKGLKILVETNRCK